jgi:hypothetical protein
MKKNLSPIEIIVSTPNVEIDSYMTGVLQTAHGHKYSDLKQACYVALARNNGDRTKAESDVFDEFVKSAISYRITADAGACLQRDVKTAMDAAMKR